MLEPRSTSRWSRRARGSPIRFAAILAVVGLLVAACGTNTASNAPGASGSQAPATQAPVLSPAASVTGTLTVWAMGNEGVKLKTLAAPS